MRHKTCAQKRVHKTCAQKRVHLRDGSGRTGAGTAGHQAHGSIPSQQDVWYWWWWWAVWYWMTLNDIEWHWMTFNPSLCAVNAGIVRYDLLEWQQEHAYGVIRFPLPHIHELWLAQKMIPSLSWMAGSDFCMTWASSFCMTSHSHHTSCSICTFSLLFLYFCFE